MQSIANQNRQYFFHFTLLYNPVCMAEYQMFVSLIPRQASGKDTSLVRALQIALRISAMFGGDWPKDDARVCEHTVG